MTGCVKITPVASNVGKWQHQTSIEPRSFACGYCGFRVGPDQGFRPEQGVANRIYVCSYCSQPTYFDAQGFQYPGVRFGENIDHLDRDVDSLYNEARDCMSVSAYTAAILTCRKLLMHVAVAEGAKENEPFLTYVEYLAEKNLIPAKAKGWVDHIRDKGNEANHEIHLMSQDEAERLLDFTAMLLKNVYEFPARLPGDSAQT